MVPVTECSWPTVTSVSVTASLVVLTVGGRELLARRPSPAERRAAAGRRRPAAGGGGRAVGRIGSLSRDMIGLSGTDDVDRRSWRCCSRAMRLHRRHGASVEARPAHGEYVNRRSRAASPRSACSASPHRRCTDLHAVERGCRSADAPTGDRRSTCDGVVTARARRRRSSASAATTTVGRQRDAGGLRAALHAAQRAQVVELPRRQHRDRRDLVPGARGDRRRDRAQLRLHQRAVGDPGRRRSSSS